MATAFGEADPLFDEPGGLAGDDLPVEAGRDPDRGGAAQGAAFVGVELPLRCRGPLELGAKACRLDKEGLGKVAAKVAGNKISEKLEEKLGDKVSPELKEALKGLFKR